ncbi:MAG TPA: hypothetical protein VNL18_11435 [Gemmatimonadales bacterium]|nr:hypothetical protein [Gemmatimonadales bacterium]
MKDREPLGSPFDPLFERRDDDGRGADRRRGDRRSGDRRSGADRRAGDRRRSVDRRLGITRERARSLPDEFAKMIGDPRARLQSLVERYWGVFDRYDKIELVQALLAVLDGLGKPRAVVTEIHRVRCQETVERWLDARV